MANVQYPSFSSPSKQHLPPRNRKAHPTVPVQSFHAVPYVEDNLANNPVNYHHEKGLSSDRPFVSCDHKFDDIDIDEEMDKGRASRVKKVLTRVLDLAGAVKRILRKLRVTGKA